jgi:Domain of unknown function (DUF5710)
VRLSVVECKIVLHAPTVLLSLQCFNSFRNVLASKDHAAQGREPMATRKEIEDKLAAIDQKKADALKALQAKRAKLKAKLAQLDRPTKSARRLDARRKILLGAFVLEQLEHTGSSPQALTFEGKRFFDWLVRPNDRAVFETLTGSASSEITFPASSEIKSSASRIAAAETPLNVPFADKDHAKALGAHWHADQKRWVVPAGRDLTPFSTWLGPSS